MEEIREIYCVVVRMGSSSFGSAVRTFNNRKPESSSLRRVVRLSGFPPRWKPEIADQVRRLDELAGCRTKRAACASMKEWLPTSLTREAAAGRGIALNTSPWDGTS